MFRKMSIILHFKQCSVYYLYYLIKIYKNDKSQKYETGNIVIYVN